MTVYTSQPSVRLRDYRLGRGVSWESLDERVSRLVGAEAVAVPSVRVAVLWILEHLGLNRHADEILVPRFLGRCILNVLGRCALPVQSISSRTRVALVVHQFGFLQNLPMIESDLAKSRIEYVEDSPAGLDFKEGYGPRSLGRLIALSKFLPVLKGGIFLSPHPNLLEFLRRKRSGRSPWSWVIFPVLAYCRWRCLMPLHVGWADALYELYPLSPADNRFLRKNFCKGLERVESYQCVTERRLQYVSSRLGERALLPDLQRVTSIVPLVADGIEEKVRTILARHRMDSSLYHFDEATNLLHPQYRQMFLIPLNPTIPQEVFESLVADLARA